MGVGAAVREGDELGEGVGALGAAEEGRVPELLVVGGRFWEEGLGGFEEEWGGVVGHGVCYSVW